MSDLYEVKDRLIRDYIDQMTDEAKDEFIAEDLYFSLKNDDGSWMETMLDTTRISAEDQACLRKYYELEEVSDEPS
jgi:hypothetical protein